jgi:rhodanese-related sulfurtransferase
MKHIALPHDLIEGLASMIVCVLLILFAPTAAPGAADETTYATGVRSIVQPQSTTTTENRTTGTQLSRAPDPSLGPYCGIFCLYAYLKLKSVAVDLKSLMAPKYVTSAKGSTLADLQNAARDLGIRATPMKNISVRYLRSAGLPVIMSVKADPSKSINYDHYMLYLGEVDGKAHIFDPTFYHGLIHFDALYSRWSATGLILSDAAAQQLGDSPIRGGRVAFLTSFVLAIAIGMHLLRRYTYPKSAGGPQRPLRHIAAAGAALAVLSLSTAVGLGVNLVRSGGLLAATTAVTEISEAHLAYLTPKVDKRSLALWIDAGDLSLIDARYKEDYDKGHIAGAINIPVDLSAGEMLKRVASVDKNARVVIYCQSSSCPFSSIVARTLHGDGYTNLFVYKGGWNDWVGQ